MNRSNRKNAKSFDDLLPAIQAELKKYFEERPHISLNALSKRCSASEPTLRRILKGQIKTLPNTSTIVDLLLTISNEKSATGLIRRYPGPIAQYLQFLFPQVQEIDNEQHHEVRKEISNPTKYLIYKLSANANGVSQQQLHGLFGDLGRKAALEMVEKGIIEERENKYFSNVQTFMASRADFVSNFKLMCDFIKLKSEMDVKRPLSVKANYSESVSVQAFKEIVQIQDKALQKIRLIISDAANHGEIPLFLLSAIDTIDTKPLFED